MNFTSKFTLYDLLAIIIPGGIILEIALRFVLSHNVIIELCCGKGISSHETFF